MHSLVFGGKWSKLPRPLIVYDLDAGFGVARPGLARREDPDLELVADYLNVTLKALQKATKKDKWIHVCEEESGGVWRFWPNRASANLSWQVEPIPNGEDVMFFLFSLLPSLRDRSDRRFKRMRRLFDVGSNPHR